MNRTAAKTAALLPLLALAACRSTAPEPRPEGPPFATVTLTFET